MRRTAGSSRVQVAILTERINYLNDSLPRSQEGPSQPSGLFKMIGKRRRLLNYMKRTDVDGYRQIVQDLGLRY